MLDKDILDGFRGESTSLISELNPVVEKIEESGETFPNESILEFSQKIDRVMGAAKTIAMMEPEHPGLISKGKLCELAKVIGYKAMQAKDNKMVPVLGAFFADTVETLQELVDALEDEVESAEITKNYEKITKGRLEWLANHMKNQQYKL